MKTQDENFEDQLAFLKSRLYEVVNTVNNFIQKSYIISSGK